jgi:hypothetical protein
LPRRGLASSDAWSSSCGYASQNLKHHWRHKQIAALDVLEIAISPNIHSWTVLLLSLGTPTLRGRF